MKKLTILILALTSIAATSGASIPTLKDRTSLHKTLNRSALFPKNKKNYYVTTISSIKVGSYKHVPRQRINPLLPKIKTFVEYTPAVEYKWVPVNRSLSKPVSKIYYKPLIDEDSFNTRTRKIGEHSFIKTAQDTVSNIGVKAFNHRLGKPFANGIRANGHLDNLPYSNENKVENKFNIGKYNQKSTFDITKDDKATDLSGDIISKRGDIRPEYTQITGKKITEAITISDNLSFSTQTHPTKFAEKDVKSITEKNNVNIQQGISTEQTTNEIITKNTTEENQNSDTINKNNDFNKQTEEMIEGGTVKPVTEVNRSDNSAPQIVKDYKVDIIPADEFIDDKSDLVIINNDNLIGKDIEDDIQFGEASFNTEDSFFETSTDNSETDRIAIEPVLDIDKDSIDTKTKFVKNVSNN